MSKPEPEFAKQDRRKYQGSRMVLRAMLCGSGKVTDIKILKGLSDAMDAAALEAARRIEFVPGERKGEKISTAVELVYFVRTSP